MSADPHWLTERQADADAAALLRAHVERACTHRLWGEDDGLMCARPDRHATGHIYRPMSGLSAEEAEDQ